MTARTKPWRVYVDLDTPRSYAKLESALGYAVAEAMKTAPVAEILVRNVQTNAYVVLRRNAGRKILVAFQDGERG